MSWKQHQQLFKFLSCCYLLLVCQAAVPVTNKETARHIKILNESKGKVEIYWVHPSTRAPSLMSDPAVMNGANFPLDSFAGHEFEVREVPSPKTGECKSEGNVCRSAYFTVSNNHEQVIIIKPGIELSFEDDMIRARGEAVDLVKDCREKAKERLAAAETNSEEASAAMTELISCVEEGVAGALSKANEEINFQAKIRREMAAKMENYTCIDLALNSSESIDLKLWKNREGKQYKVEVMHERPASKIHVVSKFIDEEECKAMEEAAKPKLHRATVADGKGGSQFSENRKAMQAGIKVNWRKEADGDLIARLSRRVYDYANHVLDLDIRENGQEDLMSIQYFGRGQNDTQPDRYTPHCDGDCNGMEHKSGTRMATMVMYCDVPELGGHTNFRNAGVHVKPEKGSAVFFSYIDPETLIMDTGFTEHSGCPVYEGTKRIVTQWIRYGVDDENPWDSFNTLGVKLSEAFDSPQ